MLSVAADAASFVLSHAFVAASPALLATSPAVSAVAPATSFVLSQAFAAASPVFSAASFAMFAASAATSFALSHKLFSLISLPPSKSSRRERPGVRPRPVARSGWVSRTGGPLVLWSRQPLPAIGPWPYRDASSGKGRGKRCAHVEATR